MTSDLVFASELSAIDFSFLDDYSQIAVLTDTNTLSYCYPLLQPFLPAHQVITVEGGEENKNLETCIQIWQQLTDYEFDRKAVVLNLGGGVIGDMGGFCAATFKRGIDFYQLPTTVLSQVDASVGGKLGIDFGHFKNHVGLFQLPQKVIICSEFLKSLPVRELRSGFAEIVKHALIADEKHWHELVSYGDFSSLDWLQIIRHSVAIKENTAAHDPYEKGLRKILNFGHTLGHAIESTSLDQGNRLLHGEAIAIGMITEAYLSYRKGFMPLNHVEQIAKAIIGWYGKEDISRYTPTVLLQKMKQDKKNEHQKILFSLLKSIGEATYNIVCTEEAILDSLHFYQMLNQKDVVATN